jgi:hypothetical protein
MVASRLKWTEIIGKLNERWKRGSENRKHFEVVGSNYGGLSKRK